MYFIILSFNTHVLISTFIVVSEKMHLLSPTRQESDTLDKSFASLQLGDVEVSAYAIHLHTESTFLCCLTPLIHMFHLSS